MTLISKTAEIKEMKKLSAFTSGIFLNDLFSPLSKTVFSCYNTCVYIIFYYFYFWKVMPTRGFRFHAGERLDLKI